jgi:thioredoxin-related protein
VGAFFFAIFEKWYAICTILLKSNDMKHLLLIAATLVLSSALFAQTSKVNWMTIEEATAAQKKEPRKILIDVYTTWCGPCKMMDSNTFTNADVVSFINKNFYAVKFNAESGTDVQFKGTTYKNPSFDPNARGRNGVHEFSRALRVSAYPTIVYLDENLEMIAPIKGYQSPQQIELYLKFFSSNTYKTVTSQEDWEAWQKNFVPSFK